MFGCKFEEGDMRQEKLEKLKTDRNFKIKLEKIHGKSTYMSLLGLVNARINELQQQKASLNINPNFSEDMDNLNEVKYNINRISSNIHSLCIRRDMIIDAQRDLGTQKSSINVAQLELIYRQAKALIPNIQRTFEELVTYHNQMLDNKVKFITLCLE